ncbi:MAG: Thymidylate kinase [Parcubacteria group bacterium GW2011_GWA2_47_26]|nr:MAG: Thymidylate kinase [Parcubacteria group bacterium GW2011_GWA2_47_26]
MQGKLIVIDGIDGSGKTTVQQALASWLKAQGYKVFNVQEWSKKHHALPDAALLKQYDVLLTAEPTAAWIGTAIRQEIIRDGGEYTGRDAAIAFSLDRQVLYNRCIIPALKAGKIITQDRSVSTSIVYQPIQHKAAPLKYVLSLPGNSFVLRYPPTMLLVASIKPETALKRLQGRTQKKDRAIFERLEFFRKAQLRFESPWFKKFWQSRGTRIAYLDANNPPKQVVKEAIKTLENYL